MRGRALFTLALLALVACGNGEGKKRAVECQSTNDCDASTLGECDLVSCEENTCVLDARPDGHRCDDSDPLTGKDACVSGICAGVVVTCDDELDPCLKAVHDPETDECTVEPVDDETPCDDDDACTQVDTCQAGACVGAEPKACAASDDCHVDGECDPQTGKCSEALAEDETPCDDGQTCTTADVCQAGSCAGEPVTCDDGLTCSVDSCDEASGACTADMASCTCVNDADCQDGNACNGQEICGANQFCRIGTPIVCAASADACLKNVCVAETGACEPEPVLDGVPCDDANACTTRDTCQAGACAGTDPMVCAALSQCHLPGLCDQVTGACSNPEKPENSSCNDGNACTATDTCQAGACVGAAQVSCTAADQCHDVGVCNSANGICSKPAKQNGVQCNDANPCTSGDACQNGACTPSSQKVCGASDSCHTAGVCDPANGNCTNPPKLDGASCSDGLTCTTADVCANGKCGGATVTCNDGIACTADSCSEQQGGCTATSTGCACVTSADCPRTNLCAGVPTCDPTKLTCLPGTPVDCSALNDACHVGSCSPTTGQCVATPRADGTTCDDGDLCTSGPSSCQAGVCKGTNPVTCTASDQCHDAGTCNSATGICSSPAKTNGTGCNDGNACTKTDSCQGGVCTGASAVVCAASDQCHSAGTCDTSSGVCSNPAKTNGSTCDDGSLCTKTDTCQGGVCAGGSPVTCAASDQCHSAGSCDAKTGTCSNPSLPDGVDCNDGSLCTQLDTCKTGVCTGANPVKCPLPDQCHTAATCDGTTGKCSNPAKQDGTACDDSNKCTLTDTCQVGVCKSASTVTCTASDQCHKVGTCDPTSGTCSNPVQTDGTLCNDAKVCTTGDKCTAGVCGGGALSCADTLGCSVDSCVEPTGCSHDLSKCSCTKDGDCNTDRCVTGRTCDTSAGKCTAGTPVDCSALSDACSTGTCNATTGACTAVPVTDGTTCDDKDACTRTDACTAGKCVGKSPVTCTASDQCHDVGSCDPKTGACSNPNKTDGSGCNDNNACTKTDTCKTGVCTGGGAVVCTALDQCHSAGICDTTKGTCSNPAKTDGATCDDGNKCTPTDTCKTGVCTGGGTVTCTVLDQCHTLGVCDPAKGTCTNPTKLDGTVCDDGNKCTQSDSCLTGTCTGTKPVTCSAPLTCYTLGVCDPQTGSCSTPVATPGTTCDDKNLCTTGESCDGKGTCSGGSAVACPALGQCLTNTCNVTLGCVKNEEPAGTPCDDGSACSRVDTCGKGVCIGGSKRVNGNSDWADDPGFLADSVDIFTDGNNNAHVTGTYTAAIRFNDKDTKVYTPLALATTYGVGIYWTVYTEAGAVGSALNIGGVGRSAEGLPQMLTVVDAAGNKDGSFTLLGMLNGTAQFGASIKGGTAPISLSVATDTVYVARYAADGTILWVAPLLSDAKSTYAVGALAAHDDGSVIASGTMTAATTFYDGQRKAFASDDRAGVWAARLAANGTGQWASIVVTPGQGGAQLLGNVTTHEDGGATLSGRFAGTVLLGPKSDLSVSTSATRADIDVWYLKLDKAGNRLWGGRVGGAGSDWGGDVARIQGGGVLLMVNTVGSAVNGSDSKTTQPFLATATAGLQTHVIGIDSDGVMKTDGLIGRPEAGVTSATRGWQLKRDLGEFYAVAGTFQTGTSFYGSVGFGTGTPPKAADYTVASLGQGPLTLFVARVDQASRFRWAKQAGGDGSGMTTNADLVMTAHPSHSITVAGMFTANAVFGDQPPSQETLSVAAGAVGNPFVVHLNSEEEYDYCP
jgi:hypothetical protein